MINADSTEAILKAGDLKVTSLRVAVCEAMRRLGHASVRVPCVDIWIVGH